MRTIKQRVRVLMMAVAMSGSAFVLQGCDPSVRDAVLSGVGSAATGLTGVFIDAFIVSLQNQGDEQATSI